MIDLTWELNYCEKCKDCEYTLVCQAYPEKSPCRTKKEQNQRGSTMTEKTITLTFSEFREICYYWEIGCDESRVEMDTCRREDMIPKGDSWGICDEEHCPYFKEVENDIPSANSFR